MNIANYIDHTALKADCTPEDVKQICKEALQFGFRAVCIPPYYVSMASRMLDETSVHVATVIGFPMGYSTTFAKVEEIKRAILDGVDEVDIVVNLAAVKSKNWNYIKSDMESTTRTAQMRGKVVKAILEVSLLNREEIEKLCEICNQVEVDFVKTSTGFHNSRVDAEIVRLLREKLAPSIKVKAFGGISSKEDAQDLISAGADRLGSSASIAIVSG
ncbi:MAG: deoxyribose-phosphate aldolase [Bacteroidota bacterium]